MACTFEERLGQQVATGLGFEKAVDVNNLVR